MNLDKKVVSTISSVTGIPETEISQEKNFTKDLSISTEEITDIIAELSHTLGFTIDTEGKEIKTVQDMVILTNDSQPLA